MKLLFDGWKAEMFHFNVLGHTALGEFLCEKGDFEAGLTSSETKTHIDLVLIIDTSEYMNYIIDEIQNSTTEIVNMLALTTDTYRVAIIEYNNNFQTNLPATLNLDFTNDIDDIQNSMNNLTMDAEGNNLGGVWSALMMAFNLKWRVGVQRIIIQLGDAPSLDPEPITGYTIDGFVQKSLSLSPISVYSIGTEIAGNFIAELINATGGKTYVSGTTSVLSLITNIVNITTEAPFAWLGSEYTGIIGFEIRFDGSGSYAKHGSIISWDWDVNGDGIFDYQTDVPILNYTYTEEFNRLITLRVNDSNGKSSIATAMVNIRLNEEGGENYIHHFDNNTMNGTNACDDSSCIVYPMHIRLTGEDANTVPSLYGKTGEEIRVSFEIVNPNPEDSTPIVSEWNISEGCQLSVLNELSATVSCSKAGTHQLVVGASTSYSTSGIISTPLIVSPTKYIRTNTPSLRKKRSKRGSDKNSKRIIEEPSENMSTDTSAIDFFKS
jgi:hypothetical protein